MRGGAGAVDGTHTVSIFLGGIEAHTSTQVAVRDGRSKGVGLAVCTPAGRLATRRFERIASYLPNKTATDVSRRYRQLEVRGLHDWWAEEEVAPSASEEAPH